MHISITFMGKIIINNKLLLIAIFIFASCKKPQIYFDILKQELVECSNYGLKNVAIDNDSIDEKGFAIEPTIELNWESEMPNPTIISFDKLPKSYSIISNQKKLTTLKLMKNTRYKISYHITAKQDFEITVWTDKNGRVYKTTNPSCK